MLENNKVYLFKENYANYNAYREDVCRYKENGWVVRNLTGGVVCSKTPSNNQTPEFNNGDVIAVPYLRVVAKVGGIRFDEYLLDWEADEKLLPLPSHLPIAYVEEHFVLVEGGDRK